MKIDAENAKTRLMLVEDDKELASLIQEFLAKHGFDVSIEADGLAACERIVVEQPDIVILDIMLPGLSGMDVCKRVRNQYKGAILMQTALDDDIDQMMGLELGADDYVIKQVQPRLLLSRIRALLRRVERTDHEIQTGRSSAGEKTPTTLTIDQLSINTASRSVTLSGNPILLTSSEFELLYLLALSPGRIVSRETIIQRLRGYEYDGLDRSVDRRVSRLRKKLKDNSENPELIKTVRGKGYQLCLSKN